MTAESMRAGTRCVSEVRLWFSGYSKRRRAPAANAGYNAGLSSDLSGVVVLEPVFTLLLIAHLLCVNVAAGGPLVCFWLEWRRDDLARRVARSLGRWALVTLAIG